MPKYYIKQKVFSWGDKFQIFNEYGEGVFSVKGEVFSFGKKLRLYSPDGSELAFIRQKLLSFKTRFFISRNNMDIAEVVREITLFKPRYTVLGLNWLVEGDFFAHDYSITDGQAPIARVAKKWFTWGDTYEIDIAQGVDAVNVLCTVIAIDATMAIQQAAASN